MPIEKTYELTLVKKDVEKKTISNITFQNGVAVELKRLDIIRLFERNCGIYKSFFKEDIESILKECRKNVIVIDDTQKETEEGGSIKKKSKK